MLRGYSIRTNCDTNIRQSESPPPPREQLLCRSCSNKHTHSLSNRRDARKHGAGAQRSGERSAARPWQPCALSPALQRQQCLQTKALKRKTKVGAQHLHNASSHGYGRLVRPRDPRRCIARRCRRCMHGRTRYLGCCRLAPAAAATQLARAAPQEMHPIESPIPSMRRQDAPVHLPLRQMRDIGHHAGHHASSAWPAPQDPLQSRAQTSRDNPPSNALETPPCTHLWRCFRIRLLRGKKSTSCCRLRARQRSSLAR